MNYAELNINAKTAIDIKKETECPTPESSSCVGCTFGCEAKEKIKYVLLSDVEALQKENKEWHDYFCKRNDEYPCLRIINGLRKQIEEYRRWLNEVQKSEYEGLRRSRFLEKFTEIFASCSQNKMEPPK